METHSIISRKGKKKTPTRQNTISTEKHHLTHQKEQNQKNKNDCRTTSHRIFCYHKLRLIINKWFFLFLSHASQSEEWISKISFQTVHPTSFSGALCQKSTKSKIVSFLPISKGCLARPALKMVGTRVVRDESTLVPFRIFFRLSQIWMQAAILLLCA